MDTWKFFVVNRGTTSIEILAVTRGQLKAARTAGRRGRNPLILDMLSTSVAGYKMSAATNVLYDSM